MAVALIYMNFLVPIQTVREKYPGGWEQCLQDHEKEIASGRVWFDAHLFHDGAMDPRTIESYIARWEKLSFQVTKEVDGQTQWVDMCCIEYLGHQMPEWLALGPNGHSAHRAGTEPGEIVCPDWLRHLITAKRLKGA